MTLNKNLDDLRMDSTRLPSSASPVTTSVSQAFKNGKVIADDGNAFNTVQGAVDAADSIVKIPPETFKEQVTVTTNGLTIVGSGYNTKVNGTDWRAFYVQGSDITITNLSVLTQPGGGGYEAIRQESGTDIMIKDVVVRDSEFYPIRTDGSNALIQNVNIEQSNTNMGMVLRGNRTIVDSCFANNIQCFDLKGDDSVAINCIANQGYRGFTITGNDCVINGCISYKIGDIGIDINGTDDIVVNNRMNTGNNSAINTFNATNPLVRDNKISPFN